MKVQLSLKRILRALYPALWVAAAPVYAQTLATPPKSPESLQGANVSRFSYELEGESSYIGSSSATRGQTNYGNFSEINSTASLVVSDQMRDNFILRTGVEWERYAFDADNPLTPIPSVIEDVHAVIGGDIQLTSAILLRVEAHPGFYGSFKAPVGRTFNVPFIVGASYFQSADLIFIAGLEVDVNANWPVFPALGVHWKVSDHWVIEGVLPRPQLQYLISDRFTLFAGADLRTGTFRVDNQFGSARGIEKLNNAIFDYWEVRGGGGLTWNIKKGLQLDIEGGLVPERRFDFYRANFTVTSSDWAPYVRVGLSTKF
jgi:hypothetical protein